MLQIVQGMYFRDVPLTDTTHRGILYTNLHAFGDRQVHPLIFGRILPTTTWGGVGSLTIEAKEHLETVTESGHQEALIATSGEQLIDEIAAVIAFCFNVVCVRDYDMARRLISRRETPAQISGNPASILRQTFEPMVVLSEAGLADLDAFVRNLLALKRKSYEAVIRAIQQVVDATLIVGEDATLAYTLMVAALESLGQAAKPEPGSWSDYDEQKRARIDAATKGLGADRLERIQGAILANEHNALRRKFVAFVLNHVEPSFYREEAVGAIRPIAAFELPTALRDAYDIRSRNVHALQNLAPEMWMASDRADTSHPDDTTLLSLEGLARLSRHVIRRFVERAPKGVDKDFRYRSVLPGVLRARMAAQYWIHQVDFFTPKTAPTVLNGMIEFLIEGLSGRSEAGLVDMTAVLAKIEKTALGLAKPSDRLPMAAIVTLWNNCAPDDQRRELKSKLLKQFAKDLEEPTIVSFAIAMVLGRNPPWPVETYRALASARRAELRGKIHQPMPKRIDAALFIVTADNLLLQGDKAASLAELAHAVETVPGLADLVKYEAAIVRGEDPLLSLRKFIFGEAEFVDWDHGAGR